jgi:molybdate transport repressor ModE-like protein
MAIRVFLRLEFARPASIGCYLGTLLEAVSKFGSLAAAAQAMGSNRGFVLNCVRFLNRQFGGIIVVKRGRQGGAYVTEDGIKLVRLFRKIEREIHQVFVRDLRYIEKIIGEDPHRPRVVHPGERWRELYLSQIEKPKPFKRPNNTRTRNTSIYVYLALLTRRLWFGAEDRAMLQAIMKYGSMTAAAEALGRTYYEVRREVRRLNKRWDVVVVTARGREGGASVTPRAQKLVARFCKIEREVYEVFAKELRQAEKLVGEDPKAVRIIPRNVQLREPQRVRSREMAKPLRNSKKAGVAAQTTTASVSPKRKSPISVRGDR